MILVQIQLKVYILTVVYLMMDIHAKSVHKINNLWIELIKFVWIIKNVFIRIKLVIFVKLVEINNIVNIFMI